MGNKEIASATGYSGTPLAAKLGIKQGFRIKLINAPDNYLGLLTHLPCGLIFDGQVDNQKTDLIHFFTKNAEEYTNVLPLLKLQIKAKGIIWVSWPKKSSKVETDITENFIRNFAIESGLVDIKICAVDETWSGLKLVIPVKNRS